MNDLDVLRDLRARVPEPSSAALAAGRARLTAAVEAPTRHPARPRPAHQPRPAAHQPPRPAARQPRRLVIAAGASAALIATATVVAVGISSAGPPVARPHHSAASGHSLRAELAVKILHQAAAAAAAAAARNAAPEPSPGQWFYSRTVAYQFGNTPATTVDEEWSTFDGQYSAYHAGPGAGGQLIVHKNPASVAGRGATALDRFDSTATPRTAYQALASLPAGPAALIRTIEAHVASLNPDQVRSPIEQYAPKTSSQVVFSYLVELMWNATDGQPSAALASVYLAVADIPGVSVQQGATDAAGQTTIAVSDNGGVDQLLLDPRTYAVVGIREVSTGVSPAHLAAKPRSAARPQHAQNWPPRGSVLESLAIAELKPVTGPGRR